jgi:hypothetical protein
VSALNAVWGDLSRGNHIVWGDSYINGLSAGVDDTINSLTGVAGGLLPQ